MAANPTCPAKRPAALRRVIRVDFCSRLAQFAAGLGLLVVLLAGLTHWRLDHAVASLASDEQQHHLRVVREVLEQRITFYRNLVQSYAIDPRVRDIMAFGDGVTATAWSQRVRNLLPNVVGAALYVEGEGLLGVPGRLRLGNQCVQDLHQRIGGQPVDSLPLHDSNPALAHFDVLAPVVDDAGEPLGVVFVSFSIDELFEVLSRVSSDASAVALTNASSGRVIASSPNWRSLAQDPEISAEISGTRWLLHLRFSVQPAQAVVSGLGWELFAASGLIILVLWTVVTVIRRRHAEAMAQLRNALKSIGHGKPVAADQLTDIGLSLETGDQLRAALSELSDKCLRLHDTGQSDGATSLARRDSFAQSLEDLLVTNRAPSALGGFCLVLIDVQSVSGMPQRGPASSPLLESLSHALLSSVRGSDIAARLADDRFAALLPKMTVSQIHLWIDRVRFALSERQDALPAATPGAGQGRLRFAHVYVAAGDDREAAVLMSEVEAQLSRFSRADNDG